MGRQINVQMIDDLDGGVLAEHETVRWALDGRTYEFDTSPTNAEAFRQSVARYVKASRRAAGHMPPQPRPYSRSQERTRAIRDWANANGYRVSARGRVPVAVIEAFTAAH